MRVCCVCVCVSKREGEFGSCATSTKVLTIHFLGFTADSDSDLDFEIPSVFQQHTHAYIHREIDRYEQEN